MTRALITPRFFRPMLPGLFDLPPEGDGWLHEIKYDGYRVILAVDGDRTRAFTRGGLDWTAPFAPIAAAAAELTKGKTAILDGEVACRTRPASPTFWLPAAIKWQP